MIPKYVISRRFEKGNCNIVIFEKEKPTDVIYGRNSIYNLEHLNSKSISLRISKTPILPQWLIVYNFHLMQGRKNIHLHFFLIFFQLFFVWHWSCVSLIILSWLTVAAYKTYIFHNEGPEILAHIHRSHIARTVLHSSSQSYRDQTRLK